MVDEGITSRKDFLFSDVVSHTLLSLYINVAYSKHRVPTNSRTQLILKQLKAYSKMGKYKPVKSDIRRLILYGRNSGLPLESKMLEVQALSESRSVPVIAGSDLSRFQDCLESLNSLCTVEVGHPVNSSTNSGDLLYLNREEIQGAFDDNGELVTPVTIYIPSGKWEQAADLCQAAGWHLASKRQHQSNHILAELSR